MRKREKKRFSRFLFCIDRYLCVDFYFVNALFKKIYIRIYLAWGMENR